jgi:hypothetical protein
MYFDSRHPSHSPGFFFFRHADDLDSALRQVGNMGNMRQRLSTSDRIDLIRVRLRFPGAAGVYTRG